MVAKAFNAVSSVPARLCNLEKRLRAVAITEVTSANFESTVLYIVLRGATPADGLRIPDPLLAAPIVAVPHYKPGTRSPGPLPPAVVALKVAPGPPIRCPPARAGPATAST